MSGRSTRGFTLIEMIAVLAILSILAAILVTQLGSAEEVVQEKLLRAELQQISLAISHYESEEGDFPSSSPADGEGAPNAINTGAERLVLALWSGGLEGCGLSPDELDNTDGDSTATVQSDLPTKDLFELTDPWNNPIAYFHHADYGRADLYSTFDPVTGATTESRVTAKKNKKTKLYYEHRRFQLISAGSDGVFGTEDDITSFGP